MCPFAILTQPRRCNALIEVCMNDAQQDKVYDKISDVNSELKKLKDSLKNIQFCLEDLEETFDDIDIDEVKPPDITIRYERKNPIDFAFELISNASYVKTQLLKQFKEDEILDIRVQFFVEKHDIYK